MDVHLQEEGEISEGQTRFQKVKQEEEEQPIYKKMKPHLRNDIRCVQNKINHICSVRGQKSYDGIGGTQRDRTPAEQKHGKLLPHRGQTLQSFPTGCSPFIHYDCMAGSSQRLRRSRDETGLDEKLLLRPGVGRDLEVDNLAPFICIRLCSGSPRCCRGEGGGEEAIFVLTNEPTQTRISTLIQLTSNSFDVKAGHLVNLRWCRRDKQVWLSIRPEKTPPLVRPYATTYKRVLLT